MNFGTWLAEQRGRDTDEGVDFYSLACNPDKLTQYVERHVDEASEALVGVTDHLAKVYDPLSFQREIWEAHRGIVVRESATVLRHIASVLNAVGCTDKELSRCYDDASGNMPHEDGKGALICAECKTPVDEESAEAVMADEGVYCGKKCEQACNQTPEVSVVEPDEPPEAHEGREKQ